jgi:3-oxoadipate enol-lactonase
MWMRQVDHFSSRYHVVIYDSRGHGLSDAPETGYSKDDRINDLLSIITALGLDKIHLVGLSMGGATALGFAIDYPQHLLSLTLVDSGAGGYKSPREFLRARDVVLTLGPEEARRRWAASVLKYYRSEQAELRRTLEEMMMGQSLKVWLDPQRGKYPVRDDVALAGKITVPTLIFVGERDRFFVPLARTLHRAIAGSELDIGPGVGHMFNLEAPERFNRRLQQFLERVDSRQS